MEPLIKTSPRNFLQPLALVTAGLVVACTPKPEEKKPATDAAPASADDKAEGEAEGKAEGKEDAELGAKSAEDGGLAEVVKKAMPTEAIPGGAALPDRGIALGWFVARNPEATLAKVGTQIVPEQYKMYTDPATLRSLAAAFAGAQANLLKNVDLTHAMGCALIEDASVELPVSCFFGYTGGAAAVSSDLGQGKQPDGKGHVAHHVIEGQDVYFDDLGSIVIATAHASLFDKSKDFVETTLIPHAKAQSNDTAFVVFPAAALKRYEKQLEPFLSMMATAPGGTASMAMYEELESFEYGFSLEADGAHLRMGMAAIAGTGYAEVLAAISAGTLDRSYVTVLPASAWFLGAYRMHGGAMLESASMRPVVDSAVATYILLAGKDVATTKAAIMAYLDEAKALYGASTTVGFIHEPGTTGAMVVMLEKAAPGRDAWKKWSEGFTPEVVLGPGEDSVSWTFKPDAATVDGVAADRWVVSLKRGAPDVEDFAKRFGGKAELTIDRFELGDRVVFVAAATDIEKNSVAVLAALKGTGSLADVASAGPTIEAGLKQNGLVAADVKRLLAWVAVIAPEKAPYPALGTDFSDVVFHTSQAGPRFDIDMRVSQGMLDQIKTLIP